MTAGPLVLEGRVHLGNASLLPRFRLTLRPGEWVVLLGPSGVGKSTLLRLLAGLPCAARLEGQITGARPAALMGQDPALLPWATVAANVALGARLRGERTDPARVAALLAHTGLTDHAAKRPGQLSGGQRQRVALARTLMEDRPLVLLDEPFSALDAGLRSQMQDLTARLLAGRMVLMVSHDPHEAARLADRICLLTGDGLEEITPPPGAAPRPADDLDVLSCQGRLLTRLRAAPCV